MKDVTKVKLEKAKITLDDCLACSGCVTSAETVLINQQSTDEVFKLLESNKYNIQVVFLLNYTFPSQNIEFNKIYSTNEKEQQTLSC